MMPWAGPAGHSSRCPGIYVVDPAQTPSTRRVIDVVRHDRNAIRRCSSTIVFLRDPPLLVMRGQLGRHSEQWVVADDSLFAATECLDDCSGPR